MRTNKIHIALLTLAFLLAVGCKKKEVIFTFSPEQPRAGQTVTFTNGTSEGEKWEWTFGDGTSSASKNPSKVYRKAGSYTVTLKVDGKNNLTYTQSLTVVDTVPRIELAEDSMVYYYHPVKLRMSAYNPYSYEKTYLWVLNDSVELLEGDLDDEQITVIFKQHDVNVEVGCLLSIGDAYFVCEQQFFVNDTTAPALFMSPKEVYGLCYQRIFPYGVEEPKRYMTSVEQVDAFFGVSLWPESGVVEGDYMYLFFSKDTPYPYGYGEDMITAFNLTTHRDDNLITSSPLSVGTLHDGGRHRRHHLPPACISTPSDLHPGHVVTPLLDRRHPSGLRTDRRTARHRVSLVQRRVHDCLRHRYLSLHPDLSPVRHGREGSHPDGCGGETLRH